MFNENIQKASSGLSIHPNTIFTKFSYSKPNETYKHPRLKPGLVWFYNSNDKENVNKNRFEYIELEFILFPVWRLYNLLNRIGYKNNNNNMVEMVW